jgi:hypothetical protein
VITFAIFAALAWLIYASRFDPPTYGAAPELA